MAWKAAQRAFRQWKILRGDKVMVTAGKDRGLTGTVVAVLRSKNAAVVEGLNLVKKHVKRTEESQGGVVTIESPLHISKLSLLDPATGAPCKAAFRYTEEGAKVRVARGAGASGQVIPRPDILKERRVPRPTDSKTAEGPRDTPEAEAQRVTYDYSVGPEAGLPPLRQRADGSWELDLKRMPYLRPLLPPHRPGSRSAKASNQSVLGSNDLAEHA